jgi:hypothetical protein
MNKLFSTILIAGIMLFAVSGVYAQDRYSTLDTMRVLDSYGRPGDTVEVVLHIANTTLAMGGYAGRILYDNTILSPITFACFERGCVLNATAGDFSESGVIVFGAYTFDPGVFIPRGFGPVAKMTFRVLESAPLGDISTITFEDDPTPPYEGINSMTDSIGSELVHPVLVNGNFSVTGGGSNQAPAIVNVGPQQVAEGEVLQFAVTAHDPNGDPITLSASNLPANSSFPTVQGDSIITGTFIFAPSFTQGPDTFYVSFVARDDHNNTTTMTVEIIVLDQPNDILSIVSDQGGVPGAIGRDVSVDLFNSAHIFGLQFQYYYDDEQVDVVDVVPTERCLGLGFWYSFPEPGKIVVLIFSPGLDPIDIGSGTIVRFVTDVSPTALVGRTAVSLDSAIEVIDSIGTSKELLLENGYFTVDRFGDANLDENVNVGDCVSIVAFIIERMTFNIRQLDAADINRDGRVNVGDLQSVIDLILQIPTTRGPISGFPLAIVELKRDQIVTGDIITIPIWADISTEAAAVQYGLSYNSDNLEFISAESGDMVSRQQSDVANIPGQVKGVFYHLGGSTFGPASGELANFTFRVKQGEFNANDININDFVIVDRASGYISSEIKGQLPGTFMLNQNYPNPFNSNTIISFDLPQSGNAELSIYDLLGRKITTLLNENLDAGSHSVTWDGHAESGEELATGVFFYRLQAAGFDETKKMLLVK